MGRVDELSFSYLHATTMLNRKAKYSEGQEKSSLMFLPQKTFMVAFRKIDWTINY